MSSHVVVSFAPFGDGAIELLARWLAAPHVKRWYPQPADHLAWAIDPPHGGERALILCDGQPVGYMRWQVVPRATLDSVGLFDIPESSTDIDLLIGDGSLVGHGVGPAALELLGKQLRERGGTPLLGLTTSIDNVSARRAFEKAGFRVLRQYEPPGYGSCYLMVRHLHS